MELSHPTDDMTEEQLTAIEEKLAGITERLVRQDELIFSKVETLCLTVQQHSDGLASLHKSMSLQQTMMDDMLRLLNKLEKAFDHSFPSSLSSPSVGFPLILTTPIYPPTNFSSQSPCLLPTIVTPILQSADSTNHFPAIHCASLDEPPKLVDPIVSPLYTFSPGSLNPISPSSIFSTSALSSPNEFSSSLLSQSLPLPAFAPAIPPSLRLIGATPTFARSISTPAMTPMMVDHSSPAAAMLDTPNTPPSFPRMEEKVFDRRQAQGGGGLAATPLFSLISFHNSHPLDPFTFDEISSIRFIPFTKGPAPCYLSDLIDPGGTSDVIPRSLSPIAPHQSTSPLPSRRHPLETFQFPFTTGVADGPCYFSTQLTISSLNDPWKNWSSCLPREIILLDECDFKHLRGIKGPPNSNFMQDEIINSYIMTFARVVNSEEESMSLYSVSTKHYLAFGALVYEELSYKIKTLLGVHWVLPDSYLDGKNKDYGGAPFVNEQDIPFDPNYHETGGTIQSSNDCSSACLNDCSCIAYAYIWKEELLNLQQLYGDGDSTILYLLISASDIQHKKGKRRALLIILSVVGTIILACILMGFTWRFHNSKMMRKRKLVEGPLLVGFSCVRYLDKALMLFDEMNFWEMTANGVLPNVVVTYFKVLDGYFKLGLIDEALHPYEEIQFDRVCSNTLLSIDVHIRKQEMIASICKEMESVGFWVAVVMACIGVWKAFWTVGSNSKLGIHLPMRSSVERSNALVAKSLVMNGGDEVKFPFLQCLSICLARRTPISFNAHVFGCLCIALLDVVLHIMCQCRRVLKGQVDGSKVEQHLASILFREAGGIIGVFCNRYGLANEKGRVLVKSDMWKNLHEVYLNFCSIVFVPRDHVLIFHLEDKVCPKGGANVADLVGAKATNLS